MELVIIGSSGTYPRPGGACNSYLVRTEKNKILLDIGPGSLSKLFKWQDPGRLDAIFISHMHPDHFTDIFPLRYYLQFSAEKDKLPIKVFAPAGSKEKILSLSSDSNIEGFESVFDWRELSDSLNIMIGDLEVKADEVPHLSPTFALTITRGEKKIFYTSDTAYDESLIDLAAGADIFLCEASLTRDINDGVAHLNGLQAGKLANGAAVSKLILTHLWPHFDSEEILKDATEEFNGIIELAEDEKVIKID